MKNMVSEVKKHFMPEEVVSLFLWYIRSAKIPIRVGRKCSLSCRTIADIFVTVQNHIHFFYFLNTKWTHFLCNMYFR